MASVVPAFQPASEATVNDSAAVQAALADFRKTIKGKNLNPSSSPVPSMARIPVKAGEPLVPHHGEVYWRHEGMKNNPTFIFVLFAREVPTHMNHVHLMAVTKPTGKDLEQAFEDGLVASAPLGAYVRSEREADDFALVVQGRAAGLLKPLNQKLDGPA